MITAALSFKQRFFQLYKSILKQNLGLILLFSAVTFLMFPVLSGIEMYRVVTNPFLLISPLTGLTGIYDSSSRWYLNVYVLVIPILTVCILFHPLHNRRAADMYCSLPLSRRGLLGAWIAAGMSITAIPVLFGYVCTYLIGLLTGYQIPHPLMMVWDFFLCILVLFAVMSISALCAVCTGTAFDCAVFSGLMIALPAAVYAAFTSLLRVFANGYSGSGSFWNMGFMFVIKGWSDHIDWSDSLRSVIRNHVSGVWEGVPYILFWTAAACVMYAVSFWYIRRRKGEMSGTLNRNSCLAYLVCIMITLSGGLAIGMSFVDALPSTHGKKSIEWVWMVLFSAVGGALLFAVVEAILKRGFHDLKKQLAHAGMALASMAAVSGALLVYSQAVIEDYVPDFSQVQQVSFNDEAGIYDRWSTVSTAGTYWDKDSRYGVWTDSVYPVITSEQNIQQICGIHKMIVDDYNHISRNGYDDMEKYDYYLSFFSFSYLLKNGKTIRRGYDYRNVNIAEAILENLCTSEEYIRQAVPLVNPEYEPYIQKISIWDGLALREEPFPNQQKDSEKFRRLLDTLSEEFLSMDVSVYYNETETPAAWVSYSYPEQESYQPGDIVDCYGSVPIYPSFEKTVSLLKEYGYGELLEPDFSIVERAVITTSYKFTGADGVLGKDFIRFNSDDNIREVESWINSTLKQQEASSPDKQGKQSMDIAIREKEPVDYMKEVSQEELLELLPKMRLSTDAKAEEEKRLIICTKDTYTIRYIEGE